MTFAEEKGSALAELRARTVLGAAGLDPHVPMERASSVTNEVWLTPHHVVRVNRTHDSRLAREVRVARSLPPEVGYPTIVAHGHRHGEDWLISERVAGEPLAHRWPGLSIRQRRSAVAQLARRLRAIHQVVPPAGLPSLSGAPHLLDAGIEQPTAPLVRALERAARLDHVDPLLIHEAQDLVSDRADALEPFASSTLIHGDVTFENVLWHDGEVTAVLDVEWARAAPADIDLDIILRCCAYPKLHVAERFEATTRAQDYAAVPEWLHAAYPEWFAHPRLFDRLRIFAIAYETRELLAFPPARPLDQLSPQHPYHRLAHVVSGESYLDAV